MAAVAAVEPVLSVENISVDFGGVHALDDASLYVKPGELIGLIGPNGAGKSTLFNVISGFVRPSSGSVAYRGVKSSRIRPTQMFENGVVRTFQIPEVVTEMSVIDNVLLGARRSSRAGLVAQALGLPNYVRSEVANRKRCEDLLDVVGLAHRRNILAVRLPLGEIRLLELARCLAAEPELLLLDELASGLTDEEVEPLGALFERIRRENSTAILLVEHNVRWVMRVVQRVYVLVNGRVLTEGPPEQVRSNPDVIEAYLGKELSSV